jgi:UDP-N-acetyl-D-glucosamine dehydrogenase
VKLNNVAVIGLGYVGLPLAIAACDADYQVIGIDSNTEKIKNINSGNSFIEEIDDMKISEFISSKKLVLSEDFALVADVQTVVICVPTPLSKTRKPDLSYLISALSSVGNYISKGTLIIIESTVSPGTTRNLVPMIIRNTSKLNDSDFHLAFSPERIDPANKLWGVLNTPKLLAGMTTTAITRAKEFYSKFVETIIVCESLEVAEAAKLLENTFRFINISFINELSIFCNRMGIDINNVIDAASTKPYGFMPFYPSVGIGGHCIPVDPLYLADKAIELGVPNRFIELADRINLEAPGYFVSRAEEKLGGLKGKKVLVVGVSYKPNVADVRETPVAALIIELRKKSAEVSWHDDLVKEWNGESSIPLSDNYDLVIIATCHDYVDLTKLGSVPVINSRGSIS